MEVILLLKIDSHSLIQKLAVKMNGRDIYEDCNNANHAVNTKNLLEYSPAYASSTITNEFYFLDTNQHVEEWKAQAAFNRGFDLKKSTIRCICNY